MGPGTQPDGGAARGTRPRSADDWGSGSWRRPPERGQLGQRLATTGIRVRPVAGTRRGGPGQRPGRDRAGEQFAAAGGRGASFSNGHASLRARGARPRPSSVGRAPARAASPGTAVGAAADGAAWPASRRAAR
ncbi:unnamed protein product [Urochloa humidicola]